MNDLEKLYNEKKKYNNFKNNVEDLIAYLNSTIEKLKSPKDEIGSYFTLNEESADKKELHNIRENLKSERNYLRDNVLSKINSKLRSIKNEINSLE